jgi:hypothetical protein
MCDFIENPVIQEAVKTKMVPVSMPSDVNSVLKISVWLGLGTVGLWAALDAFAERASLKGPFPTRFRCQTNEEQSLKELDDEQSLKELDDIRHLYAHNYAGEADDENFAFTTRRVLRRGHHQHRAGAGSWKRAVGRAELFEPVARPYVLALPA